MRIFVTSKLNIMKNKITFKTEKGKGKFAWVNKPQHHILLNKENVGQIVHDDWGVIRLRVLKSDINEDGNPNTIWKWIAIKIESDSLQTTKEWLKANIDRLIEKYKIVQK